MTTYKHKILEWDYVVKVGVDGSLVILYNDGRRTPITTFDVNVCEQYVSDGLWVKLD